MLQIETPSRMVGALLIALSTLLPGCKSVSIISSDAQTASKVVAADFALSLRTVLTPELLNQAIYISSPETGFGQALSSELSKAGFHLVSESAVDTQPLGYEISSLQTDKGTSSEYRLSIGTLKMSRSYLTDLSGTYPATPLTTESGAGIAAEPAGQSQSSDPFAQLVNSSTTTAQSYDDKRESNAGQVTVQMASAQLRDPVAADLPADVDSVKRENIYKTGRSAFGEFVLGYDDVYKQILGFPNDSLKLTAETIKELEHISDLYVAGTDVVSVIGCSHGDTALENGNALLAIGRSKRVRYFLAERGIPENRILDEGCWAPVHFDEMMPRRGVVIELKRKST